MRDFSKISPTVWTSRKFNSLPNDEARYLYLYLLSNPHCNSVGCYVLPEGYACSDLRWDPILYRKAIDTLSIGYLVERDEPENTIFLTNWFAFNAPSNQKHAIGSIAILAQVPSLKLKCKAFQALREEIEAKGFHNDKGVYKAMDTFSIAYRYPIDRVSPPETETETKTEKETKTRPDLDRDLNARASAGGFAASGPNGSSAHPPDIELHPLLQTALMRKSP